jgi:hypothetical protein
MARQQTRKEPGGSSWIESASVSREFCAAQDRKYGSIRMANVLDLVRPETAFDPEAVTVLAAAFDEAWSQLRASGSECARPAYARAMQEVVARRIIEMAQHGIKDRKELADKAVRFLAANYRQSSRENAANAW